MTRHEYERRFRFYPDVVTLEELRAMLSGIGESPVRKLLRAGHIQFFYIRTTYYISKEKIIDYMLSDHYQKYRFKLRYGVN